MAAATFGLAKHAFGAWTGDKPHVRARNVTEIPWTDHPPSRLSRIG